MFCRQLWLSEGHANDDSVSTTGSSIFFLRSCAIRTLLGFIIIHEGEIQFLTSKTHVLNIVILMDVDGHMELVIVGWLFCVIWGLAGWLITLRRVIESWMGMGMGQKFFVLWDQRFYSGTLW